MESLGKRDAWLLSLLWWGPAYKPGPWQGRGVHLLTGPRALSFSDFQGEDPPGVCTVLQWPPEYLVQ